VSYGSSTPLDSTRVTSHSVPLTGLTNGTTYHFRVKSRDGSGNLRTSGDLLFTAGVTPLVGDTAVETGVDSNGAGLAEAFQYTATATGTVDKIYLYVDAGNAATRIIVGLYSNSASDTPGSLMTQGTITNPTAGTWNVVSVPSAGVQLNAKYWIAVLSPTGAGTFQFRDRPSGGRAQNSSQSNLAALPATWSPGPTWPNSPMSAYAATSTTGPADTQPPTISITAPAAGANLSGAVTLSATAADDTGVTSVQYLLDGNPLGAPDTTAPYTFSWDTTAAGNGAHTLGAQARDAAGNVGTATAIGVTVSNVDSTPPTITGVQATAITQTGATITWTTNEPADSQVEYGLSASYGSSTTLDGNRVTAHSVPLTGLTGGTTYHFRVKSRDAAGNPATGSDATFTTAAPDTTPPTFSAVAAGNITATGARIAWTTNEPATSQVEYGLTTSYGSTTTLDSNLVTSHTVTLSGLTAGTTYNYRVRGADAAGNEGPSGNFTFTTTSVGDTTPPVLSNIQATAVTATEATITWTTDEGADTQVEYGLTASYGSSSTLVAAKVTSHTVKLTGLSGGKTYHYRVKSKDAAGNLAVSPDATFTTATVFVGSTALQSTVDSNAAGSAEAFSFTASATDTVSRLFVYIDSGSTATRVVVGLYTNTSANNPDALLTSGTITSPVKGAWNAVDVPSVGVTSGTKYWLAILAPTGAGTVKFRDRGSGGPAQTSSQSNLADLPATWSPGQNWSSSNLSAYAGAP
jgi:phosphodiesterase/alkaline phosphatase D-like protein